MGKVEYEKWKKETKDTKLDTNTSKEEKKSLVLLMMMKRNEV